MLLPNAPGVVFDAGNGLAAFDGAGVQPGLVALPGNGALRGKWPAANMTDTLTLRASGTLANNLGNTGLNTALNGTGIVNGAPGILPALGLISSIKNGDAIGMVQSMTALINPGLLFNPGLGFTTLGWVLLGAQILKAIFADDVPDAWGTGEVVFGEGLTNLSVTPSATGENFGPDRVRQQLGNMVNSLQQVIDATNAARTDSTLHVGLVPQRLPDLQWRASEFGDPGYAVSDVSGLTGQQRYANVRFDDEGRIFNIDPNAITDELSSMLNVQGATDFRQIDAYMLWSALQRGAVAPMWEVRTARLQQNAGDPNAGLTEEERAARAGLAAGADTAYASSQSQIPEAANQTRWRTAA